MSRRPTPRRPGRVILNPVQVAMANAALLVPADRTNLAAIFTGAFDGFRRGERCPDHWATMADAVNMAESLADIGIASDESSRERIQAGQETLAAVAKRHVTRGSWTLYPAEITALDEALFIHRVQLEHCSLGEFERAEALTRNRIFQARQGNAPAGAVIVEGGIGTQAQRLVA